MFFLQAAQAPVAVRIEDKVFYVPKMTMDELVNWGLDIVTARVSSITQDMDDGRKREYLTFYPIVAPNLQEMGMQVRTVEGIKKVVRQCFLNAAVQGFQVDPRTQQPDRDKQVAKPTEQQVDEWIVNSGVGRLAGLAWELADLRDVSQENPNPTPKGIPSDGDPLTKREKAGSSS